MIARRGSGFTPCTLAAVPAALLLLASPWLGGFAESGVAAASAWACGLVILSFALAAVLRVKEWWGWMNLAPGLWTMLSPWMLGFADDAAAASAHLAIGLVVAILSGVDLCRTETLCLED